MVEDSLKDIPERITRAMRLELEQAAHRSLQHIRQRTARGIGINERRFVPYAESTARRKGRREPVTLRNSITRSMLDTMDVRQTRGTSGPRGNLAFEIYFRDRDKELIAIFQHRGTTRLGRRHVPPRPWMGLTTRFRNQIADTVVRGVVANIAAERDRRRRITIKFQL